jgi:dienelactone hydrolase
VKNLLVLITDIFGETNWCQSLIQAWRAKGHNAMCISPYTAPYISPNDSLTDVTLFANEEQAYQQFQLSGGMDSYAEKVEQALQQATPETTPETNEPIICLGFSAGASALWKVAAKSFDKVALTHCIGFYPGQIRHSLELTPLCPFTLVFPGSEDHFDVEAVIQHLVTKQNVGIVQVELKHGYANPQSDNFNDVASRELTELLVHELAQTKTLNLDIVNSQQDFITGLSQQSHEYRGRTRCL